MESLSGVKGDNSVKIIGPDLDELEQLADQVKARAGRRSAASKNVGVFRIKGQSNLEFRSIATKCKRWGVSVADVENVGRRRPSAASRSPQMIEGEKTFDITAALAGPAARAASEAILNIPVDVVEQHGDARQRAEHAADAVDRRAAPASPPPGRRRLPPTLAATLGRHARRPSAAVPRRGWATWSRR